MKVFTDEHSVYEVRDFGEIISLLSAMKENNPVRVGLLKQGRVIFCNGSKRCLTLVTWQPENGFEIMGVSKEDRSDTSFTGVGGIINLKKNERLTYDDAVMNFRAFYENRPFPNAFIRRKLTAPPAYLPQSVLPG